MTAGRILTFFTHQGESFERNGINYALLNGQAVSRAVFDELSTVWPANIYGGGTTSDPIHLPDTQSLYLRGANLGSTDDPEGATRVALSGVGPTGNEVGSFQENALLAHVHSSGTVTAQLLRQQQGGGQPETRNRGGYVSVAGVGYNIGTDIASLNRPFFIASGTPSEFEVDHHKVYFYIEN